ncbi:Gfo/Idh/MocA family oxidoreductase [Actinotalea ferrariae]|uniref:Gfo/Idh/MocA family protein n=1 Tax=Actinotalea ferrariae TaxID=1386098 RepID=UPI001C8C882B|nr:Gfo/Idh/MocA family oxidoreductase [Actinotalea ferrariae]MBX9243799.1 Gfo/Idh/MocA family oxidoreductase [Actinotalea ferrariae]
MTSSRGSWGAVPSPVPPVPPPPTGGPLRFAIVGSGWRATFFWRMAHLVPDRFEVTGVVSRSAERGAEVTARWGVPTYRTLDDLLAAGRPELVVVSVPWAVTPGATVALVEAGVPVLAETPPAPDRDALWELWARVGSSGLVQVAEHSPFLPEHQARAALLHDGVVGDVSQVQVSSTHQHHAVAVIRRMLAAGAGAGAGARAARTGPPFDPFSPVTVVARRFEAPLLDPRSRAGWTGDTAPKQARTVLAMLDLGGGRSALHDFTDNQWRNPLRVDRLVLRGSHGEVTNDRVARWVDPRTVVTSPIVRTQGGVGQDMDGFDLAHLAFEGRVVYRNRFDGARLADDDIAVAELLDRSRAWVRDEGPPPYPLADGAQDHLVAMAIEEAVATGAPVTTPRAPWSP